MRRAVFPSFLVAAAVLIAPVAPARALAPGTDLCARTSRTTSTDGADLLIGTAGDDVLGGGVGDDMILGCGGDDTIEGGAGNDVLIGGGGNDAIDGGSGDDIFGGGFRTYDEYFDPGLPIPCCGPTNSLSITFTVQPEEIRSIQVRLDVTHARPADLKIELLTPVSPFAGGDPLLTGRNCSGVSADNCGPGQFHNATSVETGVIFNSDTPIEIQRSGARDKDLNGLFHPKETLDQPFRFQPSCGPTGTDCTYTLRFTDTVDNGIDGAVNYAAIDIQTDGQADGSDDLIGGNGLNDLATYVNRDHSITYTGQDNIANDGVAKEHDNVRRNIEWFYGGAGDDTLTGTDNTGGGFNDIRGMTGKDTVHGLDGDDWLDNHGTWGADRLFGDAGDDRLDGGTAKAVDFMNGGAGADRCRNGKIVRNCEVIL